MEWGVGSGGLIFTLVFFQEIFGVLSRDFWCSFERFLVFERETSGAERGVGKKFDCRIFLKQFIIIPLFSLFYKNKK